MTTLVILHENGSETRKQLHGPLRHAGYDAIVKALNHSFEHVAYLTYEWRDAETFQRAPDYETGKRIDGRNEAASKLTGRDVFGPLAISLA